MTDTPRVTVPVEPEYTATDYLRLIAEGWEVIESTGSQMTIQNPEDDGPQDLVIDVDAMLSAAQPQAREDAQPVAWRMIGRDGSTIGLQAEPYHGGFAHMMEADVGCTVQPLYTHPAPDALRELDELVSACEVEFCSPGTEGQSWTYGEDDDSEVAYPKSNITFGHIRRARQALDAPQAEQRGGA